MRETIEISSHLITINREIRLKLNLIVVSRKKKRLWSFIIIKMSSTALISCRMKIDLYLLNCYPLNPSILQTMSFVNSTCLKISKIIFCFTTIRWKNEGNIFTSLKDVTSSNAQYCACIFVCFFFLFFLWLLLVYIFLHGD